MLRVAAQILQEPELEIRASGGGWRSSQNSLLSLQEERVYPDRATESETCAAGFRVMDIANALQSLRDRSRIARPRRRHLDRGGFCIWPGTRLAFSGTADRRRLAAGWLSGMLAFRTVRSDPPPAKLRRRPGELACFRRACEREAH